METNDIKAKNREIAVKAITDFGIAAKGLINALTEVVKNRGGEIKITKFLDYKLGYDHTLIKRIFIKDGFLCVEYVDTWGIGDVDIMQFEYEYLILCSLLTYAVSE